MKKLWGSLRRFRPSPPVFCPLAGLLCGASLHIVTTGLDRKIASFFCCTLYALAAISLVLAIWSAILACRRAAPQEKLRALASKNGLTERLAADYAFRTVTFTWGSLGLNALFTLSKGAAGLLTGSWWLITFSAYYLILCIARFVLVESSRRIGALKEETRRRMEEWRAYRACGILLLVMTAVLLGVVVLIVKEGNRFTYEGNIIFAVAFWDFYCFSRAVAYMLKNRKRHGPIVAALKTLRFAAALVSMLSLQTAMFSSFGGTPLFQNRMNLATGSAVSLTLLAVGLAMVRQAGKERYRLAQKEAQL